MDIFSYSSYDEEDWKLTQVGLSQKTAVSLDRLVLPLTDGLRFGKWGFF